MDNQTEIHTNTQPPEITGSPEFQKQIREIIEKYFGPQGLTLLQEAVHLQTISQTAPDPRLGVARTDTALNHQTNSVEHSITFHQVQNPETTEHAFLSEIGECIFTDIELKAERFTGDAITKSTSIGLDWVSDEEAACALLAFVDNLQSPNTPYGKYAFSNPGAFGAETSRSFDLPNWLGEEITELIASYLKLIKTHKDDGFYSSLPETVQLYIQLLTYKFS